jgi:hypothetical protein
MRIDCTGDELLLALVSMIQVTRPALLKPAGDGFDVDIAPLMESTTLNDGERLVLRLYALFSGGQEKASFSLELNAAEAQRISDALGRVEAARAWPGDALVLCRGLRQRLLGGAARPQ